MKNKYSKKLIWDYIHGEEIDHIDELEEDYQFMMAVIELSHDKKMYDMCSDQIKSNYEFVRFLIEMFQGDKSFIVRVANFYLDTVNENDVTYYELIIIMSKILHYGDLGENEELDVAIYKYNVAASSLLFQQKMLAKMEIQKEKDLFWKREFGLGFLLIKAGIGYQSDIICEYFAQEYLKDILKDDEDMNFETFLHKQFQSFEPIKKQGIHNFLITYIGLYDSNLADYAYKHLYLLEDMIKEMQRIEKNWESFEKNILEEKKELFESLVHQKISEYQSIYDFGDYCMHLDHMNLGLPFKLGYFPDGFDLMDRKLAFNDYKCLKEVVELAQKIFLSRVIEKELEVDEIGVMNKKAHILSFEQKNSSKVKKIKFIAEKNDH